jgi:hypothetical protein
VVGRSSKWLLGLASTAVLGYVFILSKTLRVLKCGPLFDETRGLNTTGHSPSSGGNSSSPGVGSCEQGNETYATINYLQFLKQLSINFSS